MTTNEIFALPMGPNAPGARTVRGFLIALLARLWAEGEGFSGKRPFGDSSWRHDLYIPLIKAGAVDGVLDSDGFIKEFDRAAADRLISEAIAAL